MQLFTSPIVRRILLLLLTAALMPVILTGCSNEILYLNYNNEELAIALLEDNREDVEAAIADLQQLQENGVLSAYVHHYADSPIEISLTYPSDYVTKTEDSTLYRQLMQRFTSIICMKMVPLHSIPAAFCGVIPIFTIPPPDKRTLVMGRIGLRPTNWRITTTFLTLDIDQLRPPPAPHSEPGAVNFIFFRLVF